MLAGRKKRTNRWARARGFWHQKKRILEALTDTKRLAWLRKYAQRYPSRVKNFHFSKVWISPEPQELEYSGLLQKKRILEALIHHSRQLSFLFWRCPPQAQNFLRRFWFATLLYHFAIHWQILQFFATTIFVGRIVKIFSYTTGKLIGDTVVKWAVHSKGEWTIKPLNLQTNTID